MSATKILYLLGAGASCESVPLVKDFPEKLKEYSGVVFNNIQDTGRNADLMNSRAEFGKALKWLAMEGGRHASIDTFAKKLFLREDLENLKKLKATLSAYLIGQQSLVNVDTRYDSFFASVLKKSPHGIQIPESIDIITWNYDTQLEKAFYDFCENEEHVRNIITAGDKIFRINGFCGTDRGGKVIDEFGAIWLQDQVKAVEKSASLYTKYMDGTHSINIHFSWERTLNHHIGSFLETIQKASVLVCIGYSFPYFNRSMDGFILNHLVKSVKSIYLQYPSGHEQIRERMTALAPLTGFHYVSGIDLFYIPNEYGE